MKEQLVIVKDFTGRPLIRKVCYSDGSTVFVTSETAFYLIKNGESELYPIGFDAGNVFIYEGQNLSGKINWNKLKRWQYD